MITTPTLPIIGRVAGSIRTPRLRSMREFAEQEIVIPTGPFAGLRFSCSRQPFTRLFFDAVDSGRHRRIVITGPSQSGKTLAGFVTPILYHLFEVRETIIVGLPSMDLAGDKWTEDILPAIEASQYRDLLPKSGAGSRGGKSNLLSVRFANGATQRFMSGGGDDKSRSAFAARTVVITETDGLDESSEGSREADKIAQLEARTQAFGDQSRIYMECTVSLESGRTWQEYTKGTESRIAIRCPHCRQYVTPEREHLIGWQDAADELHAARSGAFCCPSCGETWAENDRVGANHDCILVHRGQEITPSGDITGASPQTETLGFRWSAVNNLLVKTASIATKEWKAQRAAVESNAEKELLQFWWAKPYKPESTSLTEIDYMAIIRRTLDEPCGRVPTGIPFVTVGIDLGRYLCHWVAMGWRDNATPHVVEYGRLEVPTKELGEERAILNALRSFRDSQIKSGWPADDGQKCPPMVCVDAGWNQDIVLTFCEESPGFVATKGFAIKRVGSRKVGERTESGWEVVWAPPGAGYELLRHPSRVGQLLEVDADHWKTWLHARLKTPIGQPGAMTLHNGGDHLSFAKHLTAEKKEEEYVPNRGTVVSWKQVNKNNHFLDASCLASVAGHIVGARLISAPPPQPAPATAQRAERRENPWIGDTSGWSERR